MPPGQQVNPVDQWVGTAGSKLAQYESEREEQEEALLEAVGPTGTIVMPAQSGDNSDPAHWIAPPVPKDYWPIIRDSMPAYDPRITPTRAIGRVAELFRTWPGALRSGHPSCSFAALGPNAPVITAEHPLANALGGDASTCRCCSSSSTPLPPRRRATSSRRRA